MDNELRKKLQEIDVNKITDTAKFSIGPDGIECEVPEDMDVYVLSLLAIEIQKAILKKCAAQDFDAETTFSMFKDTTKIALEDLAMEKLKQMLGPDIKSVLSQLTKNN